MKTKIFHRLAAILLSAALLTTSLPPGQAAASEAPPEPERVCAHDPSILKANGTYYKGTFERGNVLYGKGFYRSFRESMEGTFGDYTGIHRIFLKDGSSTTDVLIDGKVKR